MRPRWALWTVLTGFIALNAILMPRSLWARTPAVDVMGQPLDDPAPRVPPQAPVNPLASPSGQAATAPVNPLASGAEPRSAAPDPSGLGVRPEQLRQYALPDPYLGGTAWTYIAPETWRCEGGVTWTGRLDPLPCYSSSLSVRSPDGTSEFRLFPIFIFSSTYVAGYRNEVQPVMDSLQCIRQVILPRCRPEARDVQVRGAERLPEMIEQARKAARESGLNADNLRFDAGRMLVEYTLNGRPMEEMIHALVFAAPGLMGSTTWGTERAISCRAEKGKLEAQLKLLGLIAESLRENPQWVAARRQRMAQLVAAASPPPRIDLNSRGPSILDVSRSMARDQDSFLKGVDASIAARDKVGSLAGSYGRNTQWVHDPVLGQQLEVGNGYLYYYRDYYGQVHGSNLDPTSFYTTYKINNTPLQPIR